MERTIRHARTSPTVTTVTIVVLLLALFAAQPAVGAETEDYQSVDRFVVNANTRIVTFSGPGVLGTYAMLDFDLGSRTKAAHRGGQ